MLWKGDEARQNTALEALEEIHGGGNLDLHKKNMIQEEFHGRVQRSYNIPN